MANVFVEEACLRAIADAIRWKNGSTDTYTPSEMGPAIAALSAGEGAGYVLISKTVLSAGTYLAEDDGADGYFEVLNNIPWYETPLYFDENPNGYAMNGKYMINGATVNYSDIYAVKSGHTYLITLGSFVGSRFRALYSVQNTHAAQAEISGTMVQNVSNPSARASVTWTAPGDGYLTITKDNAGTSGIPTYVFDITVLE